MFAGVMTRIRTQYTVAPLLITIFLGANDAVLWPTVHVPLEQYTANIRDFVDEILSEPKARGTKILLITTPPINAVKAIWPETLAGTPEDLTESEFEEECRASIGHRTWESKLRYAQAVMNLAQSYQECGESRVNVVDFWAAATNFALETEQRETTRSCKDIVLPLNVNTRLPGCGLPGAKEFPEGVMTDRLHLGDQGYRVLTDAVMGLLQSTWPEVLKPISLEEQDHQAPLVPSSLGYE